MYIVLYFSDNVLGWFRRLLMKSRWTAAKLAVAWKSIGSVIMNGISIVRKGLSSLPLSIGRYLRAMIEVTL